MGAIDLNKLIKKSTKAIQEQLDKVNVSEIVDTVSKVGGDVVKNVSNVVDDTVKAGGEMLDDLVNAVNSKNATVKIDENEIILKLIYIVMIADGKITNEELETFNSICEIICDDFIIQKDRLLEKFNQNIIQNDEDTLYDQFSDVLSEYIQLNKNNHEHKLLLWNLMTIVYSDHDCSDLELRLIKAVLRKLNIDEIDYLSMRNSIQTLISLENEKEWLKKSERSFSSVDTYIKNIEKQEQIIIESVYALIKD